jgi:NADPH-dependent glutamate synthase beta subunit-like oxidoreductase
VGQDIARIEMLTSWGLLKDAWQLLLKENPFPAVCGRVCFHPCENACNRDNLDAPLAIHNLERFLGDTALLKERIPGAPTNPALDQKVAVAGAGPAGLSAAYFLTRLGYRCEVFEAGSAPGGMLRLGIPGYRLPRNIVDHEIKRIENQGVKIHCGIPVVFGGDLTSPGKSVADAIASGKQAAMALNTYFEKGLDYCKGCGVCATECPRNAMALEEEIK